MPRGEHHIEEGWLNEASQTFLLRLDGGGRWRLDLGWMSIRRARKLLGQRVVVTGTRAGFDLLDVTKLERAGP